MPPSPRYHSRMSRALFGLIPLLASCLAAPPPPADVEIVAPAPAVQGAAPAPPTHHGERCTVSLGVEPIVASSPTCFVDARVRDGKGEIAFPCTGGDAEARFGSTRFRGAVSQGVVDVSLSTTFDFKDGCRWISQQRITGALSEPALEYSYTESPAPDQSGCASACSARARLAVGRRRGAPSTVIAE